MNFVFKKKFFEVVEFLCVDIYINFEIGYKY